MKKPPEPPRPRVVRLWKSLNKTVLAIGALATAIAAVLALVLPHLPQPDKQNTARFVSINALSQISLSDYMQRSSTPSTRSFVYGAEEGHKLVLTASRKQLASPVQVDTSPTAQQPLSPTPVSPGPSSSAGPLPSASASASPGTSMSPSPSATSTGTANPSVTAILPGGIRILSPVGVQGRYFDEYVDKVMARVPDPGRLCNNADDNICRRVYSRIVVVNSTDANGEQVTPAVAAQRLVDLLADTQTSGAGHSGSKEDLLGELVSVNFELSGLRGKPVYLKWYIFQKGSQSHLFGKWVDNFVAYRLEATTDDDTGTLQMWIPLPKAPGPYFLDFSLTAGGASLASADSGLFD